MPSVCQRHSRTSMTTGHSVVRLVEMRGFWRRADCCLKFSCALMISPATSTVPPTETASDSLPPTATGYSLLRPKSRQCGRRGPAGGCRDRFHGTDRGTAQPADQPRTGCRGDHRARNRNVRDRGRLENAGGLGVHLVAAFHSDLAPDGRLSTYLIEQPAANTPTRTVTRTPSRRRPSHRLSAPVPLESGARCE